MPHRHECPARDDWSTPALGINMSTDADRPPRISPLVVATVAADIGNPRFYQRHGFRMHSLERDAFTEAKGYERTLEIGGITLLDRVWPARNLD